MTRRLAFVSLLWPSLWAIPAVAQGTVTGFGFGYPPGQLSTRAQGTAGAVAEIDSRSPQNPAALAIGGAGQIFAQYDPERRTVTVASGSSSTTTSRFPNVGIVLPIGSRFVVGASASMLLDRTWLTQTSRLHTFGTETDTATETLRSEGGITDLRVALAYAFKARVRIGVAGHGYTGANRVGLREEFSNSAQFQPVVQNTNLNFGGTAVSGGIVVDVLPALSVAFSGRIGGTIRMRSNDTLLTTGRIPNRYAGSASYAGLPGTLIAVRVARDEWSSFSSLSAAAAHGGTAARGVDATDVSVGVESAGPRVNGQPVVLRAGVRRRGLPFTVETSTVGPANARETSFGGGLGIPLGFTRVSTDRATLDLALLRSNRTGVSGIEEHAYNFSVGLRVRP